MTDCPNGEVRDLLPDLLHDRLAPAARLEVEAHAQGCAECREELALLRAMRATLHGSSSVNVAAIASAIPAYRTPARRAWGGWRAAAAVVILAAGGASVTMLRPHDAGSRDSAAAIATAAGSAPRELALGTSSIGDLDDGQLSALINDLPTLETLPSADVETVPAVTPVSLPETD